MHEIRPFSQIDNVRQLLALRRVEKIDSEDCNPEIGTAEPEGLETLAECETDGNTLSACAPAHAPAAAMAHDEPPDKSLTAAPAAATAITKHPGKVPMPRTSARDERAFWARQLQMPEHLTEIPADFPDWLILPRPEGIRVLVMSNAGVTVSRKRNGALLHRFPSALPGGSSKTNHAGAQGVSLLDCVYQSDTKIYFVIDMMVWKGYNLYDSTAEFRRYWIDSKLSETTVSVVSLHNRFAFSNVPSMPVSPSALALAHQPFQSNTLGYRLDGLLFYHKEAQLRLIA